MSNLNEREIAPITLKIGAVYASHDPKITRRIVRFRHGCVYYVYIENGRAKHRECGLTEDLFRSFTSHEVSPDSY